MKLLLLRKAGFPSFNIGLLRRIKTWFSKIYSSLYAGARIVLLTSTEVTLRNYLWMTNPPLCITTDSQIIVRGGETHSAFSVSVRMALIFLLGHIFIPPPLYYLAARLGDVM